MDYCSRKLIHYNLTPNPFDLFYLGGFLLQLLIYMENKLKETMVTKQYQFDARITFDCQYPDIESALEATAPDNFDNYNLLSFKLVSCLIKKKDETNANNVSTPTKSQ